MNITIVRTANDITIGAATFTEDGTWKPFLLTADGRDFQPISGTHGSLSEAADAVNAEYASRIRGDR